MATKSTAKRTSATKRTSTAKKTTATKSTGAKKVSKATVKEAAEARAKNPSHDSTTQPEESDLSTTPKTDEVRPATPPTGEQVPAPMTTASTELPAPEDAGEANTQNMKAELFRAEHPGVVAIDPTIDQDLSVAGQVHAQRTKGIMEAAEWGRGARLADRSGPLGFMPEVSVGQSGNEVIVAQSLLRQQGYQVQVDGANGKQTQQVIKQFQRDHDLDETGGIDAATWKALTGKPKR